MTLREFSKAYYDQKYAGSSVPAHAQPRKLFKDGSANELTKSIIAYLEWRGLKASRQASEGRFIQGRTYFNETIGRSMQEKGQYIPRSKAVKGSGDVTVTLPPHGTRLDIEVKYGKDRQSPEQKKYQNDLEAVGGKYIIVKTWEDFIWQINKIIP